MMEVRRLASSVARAVRGVDSALTSLYPIKKNPLCRPARCGLPGLQR